MLKKIIAFCIAGMLLYTNCYAFSDISDNKMSQAVQVLSDFSIINGYEDNTFKPYNNITRAEFAKIIISAANLYMPVSDTSSFSDTAGHWAKDYIDILKELGIINGVTSNTFAPDEKVTYEQAIKMIVIALGYNEEAVQKGGYPDGYISQANTLGITNGVNFNIKDYATRGNIAMIMRNALDVDYYSIWNENGILKRMSTNKTLYQIQEELKKANEFEDIVSVPDGAVG